MVVRVWFSAILFEFIWLGIVLWCAYVILFGVFYGFTLFDLYVILFSLIGCLYGFILIYLGIFDG